jgi:flagellar basal body-associated protein FliL
METNLNQTATNLKNPKSKSMRILTLLVVIMGIMIVVGLFVVVFTIASRVIDKSSKGTRTPWSIKANIAKNMAIDGLAADGGKLFIKLDSKNGVSHILVFDTETGKQIGKLEFESQ